MIKRIFIPFFKGAGYIMSVPSRGVSMESVRDFMPEQLQRDDWLDDLVITTEIGGLDHTKPDLSIGYAPPREWSQTADLSCWDKDPITGALTRPSGEK